MLFKKKQKREGLLGRMGTGSALAILLLFFVGGFLVIAQLMTVLSTRVTDCSFGFWNLHQLADIDPLDLNQKLVAGRLDSPPLDRALLSMWLDVEIGKCSGPVFSSLRPFGRSEVINGHQVVLDEAPLRKNTKVLDLSCPSPSGEPSFAFTFSTNPRLQYSLTSRTPTDRVSALIFNHPNDLETSRLRSNLSLDSVVAPSSFGLDGNPREFIVSHCNLPSFGPSLNVLIQVCLFSFLFHITSIN